MDIRVQELREIASVAYKQRKLLPFMEGVDDDVDDDDDDDDKCEPSPSTAWRPRAAGIEDLNTNPKK